MDGISSIRDYAKNEEAARRMAQKLSEANAQSGSKSGRRAPDARLAAIKGKMGRGKKLSAPDKAYLRRNSPQLLQKALAAERKRDQLEKRLRQCKSKDEFYRLRSQVTQSVSFSSPSSPDMAAPDTAGASLQQPGAQALSGAEGSAQPQAASAEGRQDAVNYTYRAADDAYRSFKQGRRFAGLPSFAKSARKKAFSGRA